MNRRLVGIGLLAVMLAGCKVPGANRKIRGVVRDLVREEVGPARRYDVKVSDESLSALKRGELSWVSVRGYDVMLRNTYHIDEILVEAKDIRFDRKAARVNGAADTRLQAWLGPESLAAIIAEDAELEEPRLEILPGNLVRISGRYKLMGLGVGVEAAGELSVVPPATLAFKTIQVKSLGVPFPLKIGKSFDFSGFYEPLVVTGVETAPGRLMLTGTLDWSKVKGGQAP